MTKIMGKMFFGQFCVSLPLSPLKDVEEQWVKLVSSNVMGLQRCIGGEGKF